MKPYRKSVVGVFFDQEKKLVLLGMRSDFESWQFPQGGIELEEDPEQALFREMAEEIGCADFKILQQSKDWIRYDFPKGFKAAIAQNYRGQEQKWFLCEAVDKPDLKKATDKEFAKLDWFSLTQCLEQVISWKKESYEKGLTALNIWQPLRNN